jgi:N-acetylneuraminic acid mutarotase/uncharacterized GH25 family protein
LKQRGKNRAEFEPLESRRHFSAGATVSGTVINNGAGAASETVYLDANNNSQLDANELTTTTNSDGTYQFTNVPAGAYIVRQVLLSGYTQVSPANNYGLHITAIGGATISNQNFTDTSGSGGAVSGIVLAGGSGLAGITVYLDANNNSALDTGELSTTTSSTGAYSFFNVPAGAYIVRQVMVAGYQQVTPANNYGDHVSVSNGSTAANQNFTDAALPGGVGGVGGGGGVATGATITGSVTNSGAAVAGATVYLDANNNGTLDTGELSTLTTASGTYQFSNVPAGTYVVEQVVPSGKTQSTPTAGTGLPLTVTAGATYANENFVDATPVVTPVTPVAPVAPVAPTPTASIAGNVFDDANGNGSNDDNAGGVAGLTVYLDLNNSGALSAADPQTTTDSLGNYSFTNLSAGAYIARVIPGSSYLQTTPSKNYGQHETVTTGQALTGANFGVQSVVPPPPPIPLASPWTDTDIGSVANAGSATQNAVTAPVITITGGGANITGADDAFNFAYQSLVGNGVIIAQVTAEQNLNGWAKAGVMIRESLNDDARNVMLALTPGNGAEFQDRLATHNTTTATTTAAGIGQWLELVRNGSLFTAFTSTDGVNWTQVGSASIPMVNNVYVGLCVTSHDNTQVEKASFSNVSITSTGAAAATPGSASNWSNVATAPLARWEAQSVTYNGQLYVFGGFIDRLLDATAECDVFNPATNTWSLVTDVPIGALTHAGTALIGNTVYFAGGDVGTFTQGKTLTATADVLTYNIDTNTWGAIQSLPVPVSCGGFVAINSVLYYYGGINATDNADVSNTYAFDLNNPSAGWISEAPMPNARNHVGYAAINGIAYAIGGQHLYNETSGNAAEVDAYNPATNTWTQVAALPQTWSSFHVSTLVVNGKIVIAGGQTNGGYDGIYQNLIEEYDPTANQWSTVGTLPEANEGLATAYINGQFIAVGGTVDNLGGWATNQTWVDSALSF